MTRREVSLWAELSLASHPNVCQMLDAQITGEPLTVEATGQTFRASSDEYSYVLCEFCDGGTLVEYLIKHDCKL